MFRIPSKNPDAWKHPIYLQHGLASTCDYFVGIQRNSLGIFVDAFIFLYNTQFTAFVLADAGFDVWLGNYRGTRYSQRHQNLTVFDPEYWDHRYF